MNSTSSNVDPSTLPRTVPGSVTVDLDRRSYYHGARDGTLQGFLLRVKLRFAYRIYRRMLQRYAKLNPVSDALLLDIGCGPGILASFLEEWFPKSTVVGFDYDRRLLREINDRRKNVQTIRGNAEALPFGNGQVKALISLHLIEHLYHPEYMLNEIYRILEPNGVFILATPNPKGIGARLMGEKWTGWRSDHVSLKSPEQWAYLLRNRGFVLLHEGTTFLTGIPAFRQFPLVILNWGFLALAGSLPWEHGEAYIAAWRKKQ